MVVVGLQCQPQAQTLSSGLWTLDLDLDLGLGLGLDKSSGEKKENLYNKAVLGFLIHGRINI